MHCCTDTSVYICNYLRVQLRTDIRVHVYKGRRMGKANISKLAESLGKQASERKSMQEAIEQKIKGNPEPQKTQQKKEVEADSKVNLTLRVPESVRRKLKLYAFEHGTTISQMLIDLAGKMES